MSAEPAPIAPHECEAFAATARALAANVTRAVQIPAESLQHLIVALLAEGHVLIEDYPGVGKTALARALARSVDCQFARVQGTSDLLPADVVGANIYDQREQEFRFRPGPVFANIVLVDEINRASPKTQSGLLECMQERRVTVDGQTHELARPFLVLATQNPIEYEGTYPLPEAQLDRFLFQAQVGYPDEREETQILGLARQGVASPSLDQVHPVLGAGSLREARHRIDATTVAGEVIAYTAAVIRATRALPSVSLGASPRAGVHLLAAAKGRARLSRREFVTPEDVAAMAGPVLSHRLVLSPEAELEGFGRAQAISSALGSVPVPR
jgi:MoxR-like ATPase